MKSNNESIIREKGGGVMLKKGYVIIALTIVSVLLGNLFYNNVTIAQKRKKPTRVDVINLPIDEQGNLKMKVPWR